MNLIKDIKNKFNNKTLKKIVNVYQLKYKNRVALGLGDFLRGCFCLMQICVILNLKFDIDFNNHPLSKYIINNNAEKVDYENINFFQNNNFSTSTQTFVDEFINYLNNITEETHYMMCNSFPIIKSISPIGKNIIKFKIVPNKLMQHNILARFEKHNISLKKYGVIHIRCGDEYLIDKKTQINTSFIDIILKKLKLILNSNKSYFICSDNNNIKSLIKSKFPNCIYQLTELNHLGETSVKTDNGIMFALLDFYTIGYSNEIISFTKYQHGTGFSQWCSTIFNVPIKKIIIS